MTTFASYDMYVEMTEGWCMQHTTPFPFLRVASQGHLNALINVVGVVTRRTAVFPQLKVVQFLCVKCGSLVGPFHQTDQSEIQVLVIVCHCI